MKRYLPTREQLKEVRSLKFLGEIIFEPNLWHFNMNSVSYAAFVGLFCCFLPIPFQMVPCTLLCIWIRCNIPLAIAFVWISNPITMPPMMYFAYRVGTRVLGEPNYVNETTLSWEWLSTQLILIWQPLLLGSLLCGIALGGTTFLSIRFYWRWRVARNWSMRRLRHRARMHNT